ncbi:MAG: hypothetical protein ABIT09_05350 [Croceibacterium sp.]
MTLHRFLPYRWRTQRDAARHAQAIIGVLDTPPIVPRADGLVLFSMIGTAVVLPYLVAVKSLWHQLDRGRVTLLDDGTLTAQDRALLAHHCGDPEIIGLGSVQLGPFPRGGCWERLLTILDRRRADYWVQLDSDTVTVGAVPEIESAIARNRSFMLLGGSESEAGPETLVRFAARLHPDGPEDGHVQTRIESRLGQLPTEPGWRYVRGCAGYAGFAAQGTDRRLAEAFLGQMERMLGSDIALWGTEQVASNFQLANDPGVVMLPYRRYLNYWGERWSEDAAFVHFVGTHRHHDGAYEAASRTAIAAIQR